MKVVVINGPSLNLLGHREKTIYGKESYQDLVDRLSAFALKKNIQLDILQSNHEGELIDWIHEAFLNKVDGIVINPAAYTHTSIALRDAILAIYPLSVVEVHLSDIEKREVFRHHSYCKDVCLAQISGKGIQGYIEAIELLIDRKIEGKNNDN